MGGDVSFWTGGSPKASNSRRISRVRAVAFTTTASAALQPKVCSMKLRSHCQVAATINTGGAAKGVNVPPMDTFTSKTPKVAYFRRSLTGLASTASRNMRAASVMAAGSVISEPSKGTKDKVRK